MTQNRDNVIQFRPRKPEPKSKPPKRPRPAWTNKIGYIFVGFIFLGFLGANYLRHQPTDSSFEFTILGDTAFGNGTTDSSSLSYVSDFFSNHPEITHLVFQNMPGTSDGANNLKIARLIRERGLTVHLQRDSYIASGAVDLFISGARRSMECGAKIGVHSWRTAPGVNADTLGRDPLQANHEKFLRDMGIDPSFYQFTQDAAPPNKIYVLSDDEIHRFGLLSAPAKCS